MNLKFIMDHKKEVISGVTGLIAGTVTGAVAMARSKRLQREVIGKKMEKAMEEKTEKLKELEENENIVKKNKNKKKRLKEVEEAIANSQLTGDIRQLENLRKERDSLLREIN